MSTSLLRDKPSPSPGNPGTRPSTHQTQVVYCTPLLPLPAHPGILTPSFQREKQTACQLSPCLCSFYLCGSVFTILIFPIISYLCRGVFQHASLSCRRPRVFEGRVGPSLAWEKFAPFRWEKARRGVLARFLVHPTHPKLCPSALGTGRPRAEVG